MCGVPSKQLDPLKGDRGLRRARLDEAEALADLLLRSRRASVPAIPAPVHDDDDVRTWFADVVLPEREVWVAEEDDSVVGLLVLDGVWVDQLYVDADRTGRGFGSQLLEMAKKLRPGGLELSTFQSNHRAQRFYERHAFEIVGRTDGDNEEAAPDLHYRWQPTADP